MKYLKITIAFLIIAALFAGLSMLGQMQLDRPFESELQPNRSSYNTAPTGTHAFYKLLEEDGRRVSRFRDSYKFLKTKAKDSLLIIVGPHTKSFNLSTSSFLDNDALKKWIFDGGQVLLISRNPSGQFYDENIHSDIDKETQIDVPAERLIDSSSDKYIIQPTEVTSNLQNLNLSHFASRLSFYSPKEKTETSSSPPPPTPSPITESGEQSETAETSASATPSPEPPPPPPPMVESSEQSDTSETTASSTPSPAPPPPPPSMANDVEKSEPYDIHLINPMVHIGDSKGAIVADFDYGKGRIVFLSEPFVVANNGLARGGNAVLAMNLIDTLTRDEAGKTRQIIFDEYYHGHRNSPLTIYGYFKGTPIPHIFLQLFMLMLIAFYTYAKRFARPIPAAVEDRRSPLEFVASMADLQQSANARDLAISNIYPRFKSQLCRRLGLSSNASANLIAEKFMARHKKHNHSFTHAEIENVLNDCDEIMKGRTVNDGELVNLTTKMRNMVGI